MLELLKDTDKKSIYRAYQLRLAVVFIGFVTVTLSACALLLIPSYVLTRSREKIAIEKSEAIKSSAPAQNIDAGKTIALIQRKMNILLPVSGPNLTSIVSAIVNQKPESVSIRGISFARGVENTLVISGQSINREGLVTFSRVLEKESFVSSVDLPISNLAKDKDIDFSMQLHLK